MLKIIMIISIILSSYCISGDYLLRMNEGESIDDLRLKYPDLRIIETHDLSLMKSIFLVNIPTRNKTIKYLLNKESTVSRFELNETITLDELKPKIINSPIIATSSDPLFKDQWGLFNNGRNEPVDSDGEHSSVSGSSGSDIKYKESRDIYTGSSELIVAVIDTGIDYKHEDLKNNIWINRAEMNGQTGVDDDGNGFIDDYHGYNFVDLNANPMDDHGHGTHCAGIIGAQTNNGKGVRGVMKDVSLMPIKFIDSSGKGDVLNAIKAIDYAVQNGAKVLSNSWGYSKSSSLLFDVIKEAHKKGVIFVASAGNSHMDNDLYNNFPSNYHLPNIISVAAHNYADELAYFSNYGIKSVDIAAPGRNIVSTFPNDKYAVLSGTSMSAPFVAAAIALYQGYWGEDSISQIKDDLFSSGHFHKAYRGHVFSQSRLNLDNFLTKHYPYRVVPEVGEWESDFNYLFESDHPYKVREKKEHTIVIPGAEFVRVVFERVETEKYDFITIKDKDGFVAQKFSGNHKDFVTEYIEGDTLVFEFESDHTIVGWGYKVLRVEYQ